MAQSDSSEQNTTELLLTIRDASRATGLSIKAVRRRIERGTLPARKVDGVRRIPMSELLRAGLLVTRPDGRRVEVQPSPEVIGGLMRRVTALEERVAQLEDERDRSTGGDGASLFDSASGLDTDKPL